MLGDHVLGEHASERVRDGDAPRRSSGDDGARARARAGLVDRQQVGHRSAIMAGRPARVRRRRLVGTPVMSSPPPRPVADVPPPALADGTAVAHAWLLELLAAALAGERRARAGARPGRRGTRLCAALLAAVGAEARARTGCAPAAIAPRSPRAPAALAGRRGPRGRRRRRGRAPPCPVAHAGARPTSRSPSAWPTSRRRRAGRARAARRRGAGRAEAPVAAAAIARRLADRGGRSPCSSSRPTTPTACSPPAGRRRLAAGGRGRGAGAPCARPTRVVRERAGRVWVVADGLDGRRRARARRARRGDGRRGRLADARRGAVGGGRPGRRPADGDDAGALAALADERLFAARAAGVTVVD